MKLKTKTIKFRKTAKWRLSHPFDTVYSTVQGSSVVTWAMNTLSDCGGCVRSFRDKDRLDTLRCKLVIKIPADKYSAFVNYFLDTFGCYIEQVSW